MELPILIGIVVIGVVVLVLIVLGVRAARSRTERTDWLGELSEIRRSSLGDDEEVTGALEAVSVIDDESDEHDDPGADQGADRLQVVGEPTRTVIDAGTVFNEYDWPGFGVLRVDATEPRGLRVMVDDADTPSSIVADLPGGVLWFRSLRGDTPRSCSVRTSAGWVLARGDVLVLSGDDGWSYVMCLTGEATLRSDAEGSRSAMTAGQIGRIRVGAAEHDLVDVGVAGLESEGVVRRQRRLDGKIGDGRAVAR
ncbi:MAG TPA: hypothetical protein VFN21_00185 [Acidimicrobiales bacterium]|nr:hypothetical protein [Acidimicrobiales bacterium]